MGRPLTPIDYKQVEQLAGLGCTEVEMASFVGMTEQGFIKRKKNDPALMDAVVNGKMESKVSLRRSQYKVALGYKVEDPETGKVIKEYRPNVTMLIWLGKQQLGQRDRFDHAHGGGGGNGPMQFDDLTDLSPDERQRRIEELYARRPAELGAEADAE